MRVETNFMVLQNAKMHLLSFVCSISLQTRNIHIDYFEMLLLCFVVEMKGNSIH